MSGGRPPRRLGEAGATHPRFPVPLHETSALEACMGAAVVSREQVHCWPLSSVELLTTRDRRTERPAEPRTGGGPDPWDAAVRRDERYWPV